MFKLNNKGMTTVEILVSFILVAFISASLYTTVANFNTKRKLEADKLEMNTYKNILTKTIQDDLIKIGLLNAKTREFKNGNSDVFVADLELVNRSTRRVLVSRRLTNDYFKAAGEVNRNYDDEFMIYYGKPSNTDINSSFSSLKTGLEQFPIPDLGYGLNDNGKKVADLRLTNVIMKKENSTFSLFIGFAHVDEGTKYAINIVSPINYK